MTAPDPVAVARFRADLTAITGAAPAPDVRLGVAVSGGGDSLALLLLAHAAYPGSIAAATVDHGLRAGSADEAAYVGSICAALGIAHDVLRPPGEWRTGGNVQDRARAMRYALLRDWGLSRAAWIATGHQRDDVAEGFLMRARRGAGLGGLAAMRASRDARAPPIVRPLLGWSRAELAAVVARAGIAAIADPSNDSRDFDRVRLRHLIAASDDLPADRLALAATNLRDAEAALVWVAEREWVARADRRSATLWLDIAGLPYDLRRRLVRRALDHIRHHHGLGDDWRGTGVDRLVAALDAGRHATLAGVAARSGPRWRFRIAPPRRSL